MRKIDVRIRAGLLPPEAMGSFCTEAVQALRARFPGVIVHVTPVLHLHTDLVVHAYGFFADEVGPRPIETATREAVTTMMAAREVVVAALSSEEGDTT